MKRLGTAFAILFAVSAFGQGNLEMGAGYIFSKPRGMMGDNIKAIHGVNTELHYRPSVFPLSFGLELGVANYGLDKSEQYYEFPNNTEMLAPVRVVNNVLNSSLVTRYELLKESAIIPYVSGRVGFSRYATTLTIEDPRTAHTSECPLPLESDRLHSDFSFTSGAGAGFRVDLGSIFKNMDRNYLFLDFSANYTRGTIVEYMSVNAPDPTVRTGVDVEGVTFEFASQANPELVHRYHTGYLYRTPLEMMDYRFSLIYRIQ